MSSTDMGQWRVSETETRAGWLKSKGAQPLGPVIGSYRQDNISTALSYYQEEPKPRGIPLDGCHELDDDLLPPKNDLYHLACAVWFLRPLLIVVVWSQAEQSLVDHQR